MRSTLRRDRFWTNVNGPQREGGARVSRRWWDQKVIYWEMAKERAAETDSESESEVELEAEVEVQAGRRRRRRREAQK